MATVNTLPLSIVVHLVAWGINRSYFAPDEYTIDGTKRQPSTDSLARAGRGTPGPRHQARDGGHDNISARFIGRFSRLAGADLGP